MKICDQNLYLKSKKHLLGLLETDFSVRSLTLVVIMDVMMYNQLSIIENFPFLL